MNYRALREECYEANLLLPKTGLVDLTFGNVSVLDRTAGVFAIKPSGVDYKSLTPEQMVLLDLEGKLVEGSLKPSSDSPTHRCLFLGFQSIRSVVHTHSRSAVAFAQAGKGIPCFGTTHADYFNGEVPVTRRLTAQEIQGDYEWETGNVIVECFTIAKLNPAEIPAVLVHNHGPFTWAACGLKAVETAQALEIVADIALKTMQANPNSPKIQPELLSKHFFRKHGSSAYYGQ